MSRWNLSDAAFQPLASGEYALLMAKSQENRLAFAAWLLFFRDQGRFPRDDSDLELVDIPASGRVRSGRSLRRDGVEAAQHSGDTRTSARGRA